MVLVFARNDFMDNHRLFKGIVKGWDPDHAPYVVADKTAAGAIALRPPDPAWRMLPIAFAPPEEGSPALRWLRRKTGRVPGAGLTLDHRRRMRAELLAQRPHYQSGIEAYLKRSSESALADNPKLRKLAQDPTLPLFGEALEFTAFALDEFQRRVAADGASLWLLLASTIGDAADPIRGIVEELAEARGIPVVSQHDYIIRQGRRVYEGLFPFDGHWTPTGHRWVAEALLERLRQGPEVCGA